MDGGGGYLKAWMPIVPGTLPEPEGRALVLSFWNIGATMQNISFEYFLTLSTNCNVAPLCDILFLNLNGDPDGIRTRVAAVKGRCLNLLTTGPQKTLLILSYFHVLSTINFSLIIVIFWI